MAKPTPLARPRRLEISSTGESSERVSAVEVREHLLRTPRQLPSRYFYDPLGSALFEAICHLPWYDITRVESALLEGHAAEILPQAAGFSTLIELGSGSGAKLATLLNSAGERSAGMAIHLVDVSRTALQVATQTLTAAGANDIVQHQLPYQEGLEESLAGPRRGRTLVLFLGSNIGNFEPAESSAFLRDARRLLADGDALLIGADLIKPEADLMLAYDDPLGVTAAFNRNLLQRINRELDADFRLDHFAHRARWNAEAARVEMHLVSLDRQPVHVRAANFSFVLEAGESIWTESSHKFTLPGLETSLEQAGFGVTRQWVDNRQRFALTMAGVGEPRRQRSLWPARDVEGRG